MPRLAPIGGIKVLFSFSDNCAHTTELPGRTGGSGSDLAARPRCHDNAAARHSASAVAPSLVIVGPAPLRRPRISNEQQLKGNGFNSLNAKAAQRVSLAAPHIYLINDVLTAT